MEVFAFTLRALLEEPNAHEQYQPRDPDDDQRRHDDDQGIDQGGFDLGLTADLQNSIVESLAQHTGHGLHSTELHLAADLTLFDH